ncbi:MAG TPA: ribosome assembly cofactor RimP [Spirochaetia bacterium]|nr:ribosome assembly cofactor RimP [Spirochaetia bacterium]
MILKLGNGLWRKSRLTALFLWVGSELSVVRSEEGLLEALEPVVQGLGYLIVDLQYSRVRGTFHVNLVIHRPEGVSVQGCVDVSRTIHPRLEILLDSQDIYLEVTSPGIDRKIRQAREYAIFAGRGIGIWLKDGTFLGGVIASCDESSVLIDTISGNTHILYGQIQKAKLDDTQEAR